MEVSARWVCEVFSSGYHNGCKCDPSEPHGGWRCGYRYEFSYPATPEAKAMLERHGIEVMGEDPFAEEEYDSFHVEAARRIREGRP